MRIARLVVVMVMVMGCSSDANNAPNAAAQSKCQGWVAAFCARVVACDPSTTAAACVSSVASTLDCGRATSVSSSYDRCISELPAFDCAIFDGGNQQPASCKDVIAIAPP